MKAYENYERRFKLIDSYSDKEFVVKKVSEELGNGIGSTESIEPYGRKDLGAILVVDKAINTTSYQGVSTDIYGNGSSYEENGQLHNSYKKCGSLFYILDGLDLKPNTIICLKKIVEIHDYHSVLDKLKELKYSYKGTPPHIDYEYPNMAYTLSMYKYYPHNFIIRSGSTIHGIGEDLEELVNKVFPVGQNIMYGLVLLMLSLVTLPNAFVL